MDAAFLVLKSNNLETTQSKVESSGGKMSKAIFSFPEPAGPSTDIINLFNDISSKIIDQISKFWKTSFNKLRVFNF